MRKEEIQRKMSSKNKETKQNTFVIIYNYKITKVGKKI